MRKFLRALSALTVTLAIAGSGWSAVIQGYPDINSSYVDTQYDADNDTLTLSGYLAQYTEADGATTHLAGGTYSLSATINDSGAMTAGTLTLWGGVDFDGIDGPDQPLGTLLQVTLTDFQFDLEEGVGILTFEGDTIAGSLMQMFSSKVGGIVELGQSDFNGSFDADFTGTNGTADTFVPEPISMLLLGCGGAFILKGKRK